MKKNEPSTIGFAVLAVGVILAAAVLITKKEEIKQKVSSFYNDYDNMSTVRLRRKLRQLVEADTAEGYKEACVIRDLLHERMQKSQA
jgi:hypothetical protein